LQASTGELKDVHIGVDITERTVAILRIRRATELLALNPLVPSVVRAF